ncbi:MAG TPA: phage minor head protein [Alphaproteobacteria bacterium]|nr:phage minor head protein [Alphaproteobacteria bacterium]
MLPTIQRKSRTREKTLRPTHPNAGIEAYYRRRLNVLIDEMAKSVQYWIEATYRQNTPRIAQDETPAEALRKSMKDLSSRWTKRFDEMASKMAGYFAQSVERRTTASLKKIMKDGGWTVEFKMTPAMRDVVDATVNANVSLIKSIPEQYLSQVEGMVMRSVQTGRDLGQLSKELQEQLGVTKRRAAFIARDQNSKATSALSRARELELGLDEAIWVHSGGGKHPRPTHLKAGREKTRFKISEGWLDPALGRLIQPGEEPNCRCIRKPLLKGFS